MPTNLLDDKWLLQPLTLIPAILPVVEVRAAFGGGSSLQFDMTANAVMIGIGLGRLTNPIRLPGMQHGLELDPTSLVVVSPKADFLGELQRHRLWTWPKIYVQAVTTQQFGGAIQLDY